MPKMGAETVIASAGSGSHVMARMSATKAMANQCQDEPSPRFVGPHPQRIAAIHVADS